MKHFPHRIFRRSLVAVAAIALVTPILTAVVPIAAEARSAPCTHTTRGAHAPVINVAAGQKECLRHANQTGAINVASTGSLLIVHSVVTGAITMSSGFNTFKSCASTLLGGITASGGTGAVRLGGSTRACRGNKLATVTLTSNQGGLTLSHNRISDSVTANTNQVRTIIKANKIAKDLTCNDNSPAPKHKHHRNTVGGARPGNQCLGRF